MLMKTNSSKLKLILHAGPMKTGSTAFQNFCRSNIEVFEKYDMMYSLHEYGDDFVPFASGMIDNAIAKNFKSVLISGEFICVQKSDELIKAFCKYDIERYAILIKRPLKNLYISRYLQSLKGPWASEKTFKEFIERQQLIDIAPSIQKKQNYI